MCVAAKSHQIWRGWISIQTRPLQMDCGVCACVCTWGKSYLDLYWCQLMQAMYHAFIQRLNKKEKETCSNHLYL